MVRVLLIIFIAIPVVEMWILIQVGGVIGAWPTIGLVLLTAVVGLALLRRQGFDTLARVRARLESGEVPALEMLEGLVLAVSGALLLTPGFFTDALGFAGLIPGPRRRLIKRLMNTKYMAGDIYTNTNLDIDRTRGSGTPPQNPIEGEYSREED
jgi:UPF0716 protein FxsA